MPKVSLHFRINKPYKKWKKDFDSQSMAREKLGIKILHINHEPNNERKKLKINFNTETGESGYGIRDNGGTIEAKNEGGTWMTVLTSSGGGGGGGSGTINSGVAKKLAFYGSTGTTVDDATDVYVGSSGTYLALVVVYSMILAFLLLRVL